MERPRQIVLVVFERLRHGLAHRFQTGQMDHRFDALFPENVPKRRPIPQVGPVRPRHPSRDARDPLRNGFAPVGVIVDDRDVPAFADEFHAHMGPDIPRPAGHQDGHSVSPPFLPKVYSRCSNSLIFSHFSRSYASRYSLTIAVS